MSRHAKPSKRAKLANSTYRDTIPTFSNFDTIYSSEAHTRNIGGINRSTRRQHSPQPTAGTWASTSNWQPPDDAELALDPNGDWYDEVVEAEVMEEITPAAKPKKKRSVVLKRPNVVWKDLHRQTYLDEVIRWAGRGDFCNATQCPDCLVRKSDIPGVLLYRCMECFGADLVCKVCCVRRHRQIPVHRIEAWTGTSFEKVSLRSLGLKLQLNHASGFCENPIASHASMLVLHTNGIHSVDINYCGCTRALPHHIQLLRRRLYPASQMSVKTCATFELLRHLHKMSLTTKASTYDFYRCLEKSTNNTGINVPKSRYRALSRMIVQWRHLQMLKWGGRAHDISGVAGTVNGSLAIICPTCPHPGINIPDGWEDAPEILKFLYCAMVCMDANFRLKNQMVSNYSQDPGLGIGWAYMLPRELYEAYVLSQANEEDKSTCVGFQALAKANTKFSTGLRYTGVGAAVCGRSEMVMPLGVGNLQKGERYANMDYIFGMVLHTITVSLVLISYDIACQWFTNLFKRMKENWPPEIRQPEGRKHITPAIPKLHEAMHTRRNHQMYSFNFIRGVGRTDGECPERVWGPHNALGNSTKTQGPGVRIGAIDDHFGFWNWLKTILMGITLLRRYKSAVADRNTQTEAHRGLTAAVDSKLTAEWEVICQEWDEEPFPKTKRNPYYTPNSTISEAQVKKNLAQTEAQYLEVGGIFPHTTTVSIFVGMGLDIEDSQRRLRRAAKESGDGSTTRQQGTLIEHRNLLTARIRSWEQLLPIYIPGLLQFQLDHPDTSETLTNVEDQKLWLPSNIPASHRLLITLQPIVEIEIQLRMAQMSDALEGVRQVLKLKARMVLFKNKNIRGQRQGTRLRTIIDRVHERARNMAAKYRASRTAYLALVGPGEWEKTYRILNDSDIRGYQDPNRLRVRTGRQGIYEDGHDPTDPANAAVEEGEFELLEEVRSRRDGTGETRRTLSWIWTVASANSEEDDTDDILRVEWSKSRARVHRAGEEVLLLKEEMRRCIQFLEWRGQTWRDRGSSRPGLSKDMLEAVSAYSIYQASIHEALATNFRELWKAPLTTEDIDNEDIDTDEEEEDEEEEAAENGQGNEPSEYDEDL